jgi:THO complex subunit 1
MASLEEPWKSIAVGAIPPAGTEPLPSAASRLEQLELATRSQLLQLFQDPNCSHETAGNYWKSALELCQHLVHHASVSSSAGTDAGAGAGTEETETDPRYANMAARKLPLILLEDCLDGMSVADCQEFWTHFVEPALDQVLLGDLFWESSPVCHLPFLRVCNQFLKLLENSSNSNDQEWKGRILWALSKGFSIADRSALKAWGSFHTSNSNDYETKEEFEKDKKRPTSTSVMNYSLYKAFWSLQADFSNPNRIQVGDFIKKMKRVLEALESSASASQKQDETTSTARTPAPFSLRYMTSSSLLPTQLATAEFRSSVICQFLIAASHLSSESPALANALATLLARAKKLLKSDNPELYAILWESILSLSNREPHWRQWKKNKCPASAFAPKRKPEEAKEDAAKQRSRRLLLLDGPLGSSKNDAASEQVYELLKKDDLIQISQELQKTVPTLEHHLEPYVEALDPEAGIEDEYHPKNDSLYTWRAMRLFAKHQLPLLKKCRQPADLERMTREWYQAQGKVIPGDMPPPQADESDSESSDSSSDDEKENEDDNKSGEAKDAEMNHAESNDEEGEEKEKDSDEGEEDSESISDAADEVEESAENDAKMEEKEDESHEEGAEDSSTEKEDGASEEHDRKGEKEMQKDTEDGEKGPDEAEKSKDGETKEGETKPSISAESDKPASPKKSVAEDKEAELKKDVASNPPSRGVSDDDGEIDTSKGNEKEQPGKRKRSRSSSRERGGKLASHPPRDIDRGRDRPRQPPRGGRRDDVPPPPRGGRHDEGPPPRGGRRNDDPPPPARGGRRDDGPPPTRGGRRDDGPLPRGGARHDEGPPPRGGRRHGDGPGPRGGRGSERFAGDPGREDHHRGGGDRRRGGGRDDGRWRGRGGGGRH